ncbi:MAG: type II toxin-antitoxin system VapC family toxin [Anaerolineae bacterium]|nr:type II toxin-antitoxin system VapC family toxin [Anaerolineae bacterium]
MNHRQPFIFTDTSAWFALAYEGDPHYQAAQTFIASNPRLITTNFIIDETITLVLARLGHWPARELGERLWSGWLARVIYVSKADQRAAWELFKKYDDKEFSFTDCTSFVVMERLGLVHAFAFDEHFEQTGQFIRLPRA